jgi:predicted nucleotidyltransferase component of viral defense system
VIPRAHITGWRSQAPWPTDAQVEQDLVLTRALVEIFKQSAISEAVAFRGGTALHKLYFDRPGRYSEDIDLVQIEAGPIGNVLDAIRERLDPWLGEPRRRRGQGRVTIVYRFDTTFEPSQRMRLKIEINSREHFSVLGLQKRALIVNSPWYSDSASITVYGLEELLGTKLRALYQRKKGRDLYDLWRVLVTEELNDESVIECFQRYIVHGGLTVTRAQFEENLANKMQDNAFLEDIAPLLPTEITYQAKTAYELVSSRLIARKPEIHGKEQRHDPLSPL